MKKRIISMLLVLTMMVGMVPVFAVETNAATVLTISQPDNWEHISKSDPPTLKWSKITGAAGYRVTVKNDETGAYYTQNEWTTKTSYSLADLFDEELGSNEYPRLKIWVGAMASKNDDPGLTSLSNTYIIAVVAEVPDISVSTPSGITSDGATLKVTVNKNYGSGILDAGFYIGTSSSRSRATKYSVDDFGPSSIMDSGTMTMKITGLKADTKYYCWGYAENYVGETVTSSYKTFRTEEDAAALSLSKTSVNLAWGAGNEDTVTVTCSGSYTCSVGYNVSSSVISAGKNYEWLKYDVSGNQLRIYPDRANYSASARTAYITVTSGGVSKEITVKQNACGETAPTISLHRGGSNRTYYSDGDSLGTFDIPQNDMVIDITSSNVRKVYAELSPVNGDAVANCASTTQISFDISALSAGTYKIVIYASNSSTSNDYWSQSPFPGGSCKLYFTLKGSDSGPSSDGGAVIAPTGFTEHEWNNITNYVDLDRSFEKYRDMILPEHQNYVINAIKYHISREHSTDTNVSYRTAKNLLGKNNTADGNVIFFFDGVSTNINGSQAVANGYKKNGVTYNLSAVCIVVRLNEFGRPIIVFASKNSSTMPDIVRKDDNGVWRPILIDGAYSIQTITHSGFASLRVQNAKAVRCSPTSFVETSISADNAIDLHCRWSDGVTTTNSSYQNSTGCYTIGIAIDNDYGTEYSDFIYAVTGFENAVSYPNNKRTYKTYNGAYTPSVNYNEQKFVYYNNTTCGMMIVDRFNYKEQLEVIYGGAEKNDSQDIVNLVIANSRRWHMGIEKNEDENSGSYTVTYNYNYDGGPIKTETKNHGETYTISNTIIPTCPSTETNTTITSYKFYGWAISEEGDVIYQPGDTYTQNSNLTLYAQWTTSVSNKPQAGVTVYSVIYDANGGSNAPDPSNGVKSGTTITLSTAKPTRSGYTFLGWSLDKNDDVADYQPGDSYTVTGATTLYAVWEKKSSGGGSSGGESNQTYIISGEITSYTSGGNYTIVLYDDDGEEYGVMVSRLPDYEFEVTPGRYTLEVRKAKHITYRCDIVINSMDITQNITLYLLGDCGGDGEVNGKDAVLLRKYMVNYNYDTGTSSVAVFPGADANGDGEINGKDAVLLRKYMVNYNYDTGTSSVVLGPQQ